MRAAGRRSCRLRPEIERVWEQNDNVYGLRKVWHQMRRDGIDVARCTVARLMKDMGIEGAIRGKNPKTTIPDKSQPCPRDKVKRQFKAPNVWTISGTVRRPTIVALVHPDQGQS